METVGCQIEMLISITGVKTQNLLEMALKGTGGQSFVSLQISFCDIRGGGLPWIESIIIPRILSYRKTEPNTSKQGPWVMNDVTIGPTY